MSLAPTNLSELALIVGSIPVVWSIIQFILVRKSERKDCEFEIYHRLIKELFQPDQSGAVYLDRQIAALHELARFRQYREPTLLIVEGLRTKWSRVAKAEMDTDRLILQLERTMKALR